MASDVPTVTETRSFREVAIPLSRNGDTALPGVFVLRAWRDEEGGCSLEVECASDFDKPRPPFWKELKTRLKQRGFDLETDGEAEEDEIFAPTSFFSADAVICGRKLYRRNQTGLAAGDIDATLRCLGDRVSSSPATRWNWQPG